MVAENSSLISGCWLCPLYSFNCDSDSVELTGGIQIKPAYSEFKDFIRKCYTSEDRWGDDPSVFDWVFALPCGAEAIDDGGMDITTREDEDARAYFSLTNFITACRLYQKGSITPGTLIFTNLQSLGCSVGTRMFIEELSKNGWSGEPRYEFRHSNVPQINNLLKNLIGLHGEKEPDNLDVALRRFNSAYIGEPVDRVIDQMIAFESLYIGDDKELAYKLALRTAFLLAKDKDKRKAIFGDMKRAYDLRSKVVHGSKQVKFSELAEIIPKVEEYLRQSIRRFLFLLSQGKSLKEIRDNLLDENILKNGKPLTERVT